MSRVRFVARAEGANGWRIEPHSHPLFGQIVFVRGGAGLMTVEIDRRPFASPSVLIVPVNTVHGFEYGMDSDGWVLTLPAHCPGDHPASWRHIDRALPEQHGKFGTGARIPSH